MRIILCLLLVLFSACSSVGSDEYQSKGRFEVDVLFSPSGFGDHAYNDIILYGIQKAHKSLLFNLNIHQPTSVDEGWRIFESWKSTPETHGNHLFIFASVEYEKLLMEEKPIASENRQLILFQSEKRMDKVRTFNIETYGAAYMLGQLIGNSELSHSAAVILANEEDSGLWHCNDGFRDGFLENEYENQFMTYYLAKHLNEGYNMPDSLYRMSEQLFRDFRFVFPIAGESNKGLYQFIRDNGRGLYSAGIDAEMSEMASGIVCSLVKRFDLILERYINEWMEGEKMEGFFSYGLDSEYVYVVVSPDYQNFFQPYQQGIESKAKMKEHEYLENHK